MKVDRGQFEQWAMEHLDMLYRIARRLTRDEASAEAKTFVRILLFKLDTDGPHLVLGG